MFYTKTMKTMGDVNFISFYFYNDYNSILDYICVKYKNMELHYLCLIH